MSWAAGEKKAEDLGKTDHCALLRMLSLRAGAPGLQRPPPWTGSSGRKPSASRSFRAWFWRSRFATCAITPSD